MRTLTAPGSRQSRATVVEVIAPLTIWRRLLAGQALSVLLTALLVLAVSWPVQAGRWVDSMPNVGVFGLLGLALALLLGQPWSPIRRRVWVHLCGLGIGVALVGVLAVAMTSGASLADQAGTLVTELRGWFAAWPTNELKGGRVEFAVLMLAAFWVLGFWGGWLALRHVGWPIVIAGGLTTALVVANLAEHTTLYLLAYMATAVVLLIHLATARRQELWTRRRLAFDPLLVAPNAVFVLLFGLVIVILVGVMPTPGWLPWEGGKLAIDRGVTTVEDGFGRLFSGLPSRSRFNTLTYADEVRFQGNPNLTATVLFNVQGVPPAYWRARTYTTYTGNGWATDVAAFAPGGVVSPEPLHARVDVRHSFRVDAATDTLFAGGEPLSFTLPWEMLVDPVSPTDVLQVRIAEGRQFFPTRRNLRYVATGSISVAAPGELRGAGTAYPGQVAVRYLQVPASLPDRVRAKTLEVTAPFANPYDKAEAIREFLSGYAYNLDIEPPGSGQDGVDYFLFTLQQGYCDYYASAMVMMLRSIGIPARYVVGYAPGSFKAATRSFEVLELNYHSWPEVYFPGYGWFLFEPTPPSAIEFGGVGEDERAFNLENIGELFIEEEAGDIGQAVTPGKGVGDALTALALIVLGVVVVVIGLGMYAWYRWWWRLGRLPRPAELYAKMRRLATALGFPPSPSQTPREYGWYLAQRVPAHAWAVVAISHAYTTNRYGQRLISMQELGDAERAWRTLRWVLVRRLVRSSKQPPGVVLTQPVPEQ